MKRSTSDLVVETDKVNKQTEYASVGEIQSSPQDGQICFCKTTRLRFKQFIIELKNDTLRFYRNIDDFTNSALAFEHDIFETHFQLGPTEKCKQTNTIYYAMAIVMKSGGLRLVYFPSIELRK